MLLYSVYITACIYIPLKCHHLCKTQIIQTKIPSLPKLFNKQKGVISVWLCINIVAVDCAVTVKIFHNNRWQSSYLHICQHNRVISKVIWIAALVNVWEFITQDFVTVNPWKVCGASGYSVYCASIEAADPGLLQCCTAAWRCERISLCTVPLCRPIGLSPWLPLAGCPSSRTKRQPELMPPRSCRLTHVCYCQE